MRGNWISPFNGLARQHDGLTVFASDGHGHERVVVRRDMPLVDALREIAWQLDEWGGDWRIDCISTPSSIWRYLQGSRATRQPQRQDSIVGVRTEPVEEMNQHPELTLLGRIGRADLFRGPRG